jgi:dihydrofolate reductase
VPVPTRKLIVSENMTLDGVIDLADDWFTPPGVDGSGDTTDLEETVRGHMAVQDALLLGRRTFEAFRAYWPKQTDDTTGITAHLNQVKKYVVSSSLDDPQWANTVVLRGDLVDEVRTLKESEGAEIAVGGSISVVWKLIAAGLVDEYRIFVHPVVLGHGRRLFEGNAPRPKLELVESRSFRAGVVLMTYRVG